MSDALPPLKSFLLTVEGAVAWLRLNRPAQANSLDAAFWTELPEALRWIAQQPGLRVVVLAAEGKHFCAGIDLGMLRALLATADGSAAGRAQLVTRITELQASISAIEECPLPVIAAVQGACVGGGVDLIAACDLRYCSADARFCIKEVDFGIVADAGTTQRLRHVIGLQALSELSLTAETFGAERARALGLVGEVLPELAQLHQRVAEIAQKIAAKPPIATQGVKQSLLFARDHSVAAGLRQVAEWNAAHGFAAETQAALQQLEAKRARS
ncbi:MAG: enoyl-CoA hydratase-related protein [Pseudomonadota bacterium]